jgi:hypothetical protein
MGLGDGLLKVVLIIYTGDAECTELMSRMVIFILNGYEIEQAAAISIGNLSENVGI